MAPHQLSFLVALFCSIQTLAAKTCYTPDGSIDDTLTPCNLNAEHSQCCKDDQVCLDNGYCWGGIHWGNNIARQGCTDKTWTSDACPYYCADEVTNGGIALVPVAVDDVSSFCCGPGYNSTTGSCQYVTRDSMSPFQVPNGKVIYNRNTGSTGPNATTTAAATVTVTAKATSGLGSLPADCSNHNAAIGAGIGVPLGLLLLLACGLLVWQMRQRKALEKHLQEKVSFEKSALGRDMTPPPGSVQKHELGTHSMNELDGHQHSELSGSSVL